MTTLVALLALVPQSPFLIMVFVVSLSARLAAPLVMLFVHGVISRPFFLGSVWIVGVGMPLLVLALNARTLVRAGSLRGPGSTREGISHGG